MKTEEEKKRLGEVCKAIRARNKRPEKKPFKERARLAGMIVTPQEPQK